MSSSEFPPNTKKSREKKELEEIPEPKPKTEQVVQSQVIKRKKPLGRRMKDVFIGDDAGSVWQFVAYEVLVPAAKDMVADAVSQGIERMIFGEARSTSRRTGRHPASRTGGQMRTNYNEVSGRMRRGRPESDRRTLSQRARASHDFDEIIIPTRVEADEVLDRLYDLVNKYEVATVADLYDLVGVTGSYTDDKWGWYDLRGSGVHRVRHGYLLDLPRPEPLD